MISFFVGLIFLIILDELTVGIEITTLNQNSGKNGWNH